MKLEGKKANFLGDSITAGSGCADKIDLFMNVLKRDAGLKEARNYGIGGTRIARQSTDSEQVSRAYVDRYQEMDDDADIVVVFGGTNDYGHGDAKMGVFTDRTATTFYGACHLLMAGLMEKYPTGTIVIMTPVHRCGEDTPSTGNNLPMKAYVNAIREVAAYYALPVLDLYSVSGIQPDLPISKKTCCPDGLHPNEQGHKVIESRLKGFLEAL